MIIIAHRCGPEVYPQLTVAAAKSATAAGAAYVEIDIRYTADGLPVVNHDDSAQFLFGCPRKISELTSTEFLALRHKTNPAFPAHSFEHFLQCGVKNILFHIKEGGEPLKKVLALCRQYDAESSVVFGVQRTEDVRLVKEFNPNIGVLAFMPGANDSSGIEANIRAFSQAGADYIRLWEKWEVEALAPTVRQCGKKIWIMANNPEVEPLDCGYTSAKALRYWRDFGIDGILVNNPTFAQYALHKK